jgi:hypothetical protein
MFLGIRNEYAKKHELSSRFIYNLIEKTGGPEIFFGRCYLTAVSPFGFIRGNKNMNYYDDKSLKEALEPFLVDWLEKQVDFGANRDIAFSLGMGKNLEYLKKLNSKYRIFNQIEGLPHPRWVMQYRYKKRHEISKIYIERLGSLNI